MMVTIGSSIVLIVLGYVQQVQAFRIKIREGRSSTLSCSAGEVLNIISATYSRSFCQGNDVTGIVQDQCHLLAECVVYAEDEQYGSTCFVLSEDLTITYNCIERSTTETYTTASQTQTITGLSTATEDYSYDNITGVATEARTAILTNNHNNKTTTIVTLTAACVFVLVLVVIGTVAVMRRFKEKKAMENETGLILQLNGLHLVDQNNDNPNRLRVVSSSSATSGVRSLSERSFDNNFYGIDMSDDRIIPDLLKPTNNSSTLTSCKEIDGGEYASMSPGSSDSLPPSYDVVNRNRQFVFSGDTKNVYNRAHYCKDAYDTTITPGRENNSGKLTDADYNSSTSFLPDGIEFNVSSEKSEKFYENEGIASNKHKNKSKHRASDVCAKNTKDTLLRDLTRQDKVENNQYANVEFKKSKVKYYQNVENEAMESTTSDQRYMPMHFSSNKSNFTDIENAYVPVMSPTLSSTSDVFEDTYQF